jgi:hypothetical protein
MIAAKKTWTKLVKIVNGKINQYIYLQPLTKGINSQSQTNKQKKQVFKPRKKESSENARRWRFQSLWGRTVGVDSRTILLQNC